MAGLLLLIDMAAGMRPAWAEEGPASTAAEAREARALVATARELLATHPWWGYRMVGGGLDPTLAVGLDLNATLDGAIARAVPVIGCHRSDLRRVGFYDPLDNLWVILEIDEDGTPWDVALGTGAALSDGRPAWWPYLIAETGGLRAALQQSVRYQIADFSRHSPPEGCPRLFEDRTRFVPGTAVAQIAGLSEEQAEFTEQDRIVAEGALVGTVGFDGLRDWEPARVFAVPDMPTRILFHQNPARPGVLMTTIWTDRPGGAPRVDSDIVSLLPAPGDAP